MAHLVLVRVAIEQRLSDHDESRGAEAALQRGMLQELALKGILGTMPSTVITRAPSTSPPSTRQAFTKVPFSSTAQSPLLHPSLALVIWVSPA